MDNSSYHHEHIALNNDTILHDRQLKIKKMNEMLGDKNVCRIIYDEFSFSKIRVGWVPKGLSAVKNVFLNEFNPIWSPLEKALWIC